MKSHIALVLALSAASGCAVEDDRPQTLAYITETILAPNCGTAECHSARKNEYDYAFDTVENAQGSLAGTRGGQVLIDSLCPPYPARCDLASGSYLLTVMTDKDSLGNRMPYDEPMPTADIVLIANWITNGAPGYVPPASQTPPDAGTDAGAGN